MQSNRESKERVSSSGFSSEAEPSPEIEVQVTREVGKSAHRNAEMSDEINSHGQEEDRQEDNLQGKNFQTAAVFCVGNRLKLDDGIGPAVYDEILEHYEIPENVDVFDVGCMSMSMLPYVQKYDFILTVDAVDGTGEPAGTVFRFDPDDMARHSGAMASLHDLKLVDLFDAATLLGYTAEGKCVGMQIDNSSPKFLTEGLTPAVAAALPLLVETVVAELFRHGFELKRKSA